MPMHLSVAKQDTIQIIDQTQVSPLVTKGVAKVLYIGDNRNGTSIDEVTAIEMGRKLPGSPVVGYYRDDLEDFEEHSRKIEITTDKFEILDLTKPYGFVPTNSKIWLQDFVDDNSVTRRYLCCEVYIWTSAYPESQRVFEKGNNQSMELDNKTIKGVWTNSANSQGRIFIINEALIEKLCILGEDFEPCFEGAAIQSQFALQFSKEIEQLKTSLFSLMNEVNDALNDEGGPKMEFTNYLVEIGDALWSAIYSYLENTYPVTDSDGWTHAAYCIRGIYEEGSQKFAIIQKREDNKLFRMNFSYTEAGFDVTNELQEVEVQYVPVENFAFSVEDNDNYKKKEEVQDNSDEEKSSDSEEETEGKEEDNGEEDNDKEKGKYVLEEIPEYVELNANYNAIVEERDRLNQQISDLNTELETLKEFKLKIERAEKEAKIAEFFMLSDEDKADVIENIDKYSLDDIEAKLSVICFHNKVSFVDPSQEEKDDNDPIPTNFNLQGLEDNDSAPEWVKAVRLAQSERDC